MVFICDKCSRTFSSKHRLNTHIESDVCVRRFEKLMCKLCHQKFANNNGYKYHVEQHVCQKYINTNNDKLLDVKQHIDVNEANPLLEIEKMKLELQIEEQHTKQKQIESEKLKQIEEERTKQKQIEAEEKTKQKQLELEILKAKMIIKMKVKNTNNTTTNITNSNNNNNYTINLHPVAFGKEDFSELDDERMIKYLLNRPHKAIEEIVNIIYCSKNNKLNHTVYIPARNQSIAMVSNGQRFIHRDANEAIQEIFGNSKDKLDDLIEANGDKLNEFMMGIYTKNEYDPKHEAKVKKNIKFGIIDMESTVKKEISDYHKLTNETDTKPIEKNPIIT